LESDTDVLFRRFIARIDRDTLATEAEQVLKEKAPHGGGIFVFADYPSGLIGFTLRKLLLNGDNCCGPSDVEELVNRLVAFYEFSQDWLPPRLLVREALALTFQRRRIIEQLRGKLGNSIDLASYLERAAARIRCAKDAFLLDDNRMDDLLEELRQLR